MQHTKPSLLTLSVIAAMSSHTAFGSELNTNLATTLGYAEQERELLNQQGGSPVFDELGQELVAAVLASDLDQNRRFVAQANDDGQGFTPLHIEGTLSSIYDYVPVSDMTAAQAVQLEMLPPEDGAKKIMYADVGRDIHAQTALEKSSVIVTDNPYSHVSTDRDIPSTNYPLSNGKENASDAVFSNAEAHKSATLSTENITENTHSNSQSVDTSVDITPISTVSADIVVTDTASIDTTIDTMSVEALYNAPLPLVAASDTSEIVESAVTAESTTAQAEVVSDTVIDNDAAEPVQKTAVEMAQEAESTSAPAASTVANSSTESTKEESEPSTPSMVPEKEPESASDALKQKEDDTTSEKSLEEVFTASEKRYSLLKQGNWGLNYDARYSYYRDSRIDIATRENSSDILRFRVEEDSQHTLTNSFNVQYGLRDNLTLSADLPIVAKTDLQKDASTVGLGDVSLGARWEPFPLEKDRLPLIFNGNVTLPTGDSPYDVDRSKGLATGRGYYGIGGGVSTRKYIDPVVLFGSASLNYGFQEDGLDQRLGGDRTLVGIRPNLGAGIALGFAYSLNYDVSLTMSYQQSFSVGSEFTVRQLNSDNGNLEEVTNSSADQTSATLNMALGVRISPKTIVNTSVGIGLTEDTPDVSFGVSFPLDFAGFGKK